VLPVFFQGLTDQSEICRLVSLSHKAEASTRWVSGVLARGDTRLEWCRMACANDGRLRPAGDRCAWRAPTADSFSLPPPARSHYRRRCAATLAAVVAARAATACPCRCSCPVPLFLSVLHAAVRTGAAIGFRCRLSHRPPLPAGVALSRAAVGPSSCAAAAARGRCRLSLSPTAAAVRAAVGRAGAAGRDQLRAR
jgi:hypothetical protein